MTNVVLLDAGGLSSLRSSLLRTYLREAVARGAQVWCSSITIAEVARGRDRSAELHHALRREAVRVKIPDQAEAFVIGSLLHDARLDSSSIADACVVSLARRTTGAVVITTDPSDIRHLADHLPGVRITTRHPDLTRSA